jgi:hypothetical protein
MRYSKETTRLTVKFIDGDTNEELFDIPNRNIMDIPELFSDVYVTEIAKGYLGDDLPENITVLIVGQYKLR